MNKKLFSGSIYAITILALVLIFSGIGFAQTPGAAAQGGTPPDGVPPGGQGGAKLDQTPMFNEIDANKDGKATSAEWKAAGAPDMVFQMVDTNKDSQVTLEELNTSSPPADVDKNKDGKASLSEVKEFMASMPAGGAPGGAPPTGAPPAGGFAANSPHVGDGPTGQDFINALDTDKDGKVTHDEWEMNKIKTVYKNKIWPEYNKNMDQYITLDEAPQKGVNWEAAPAEPKTYTVNTNQIAFIVKFDKNQDGKVDNTEFTGQHFPVYDKNSDGFIEPHEAPEGQTAY